MSPTARLIARNLVRRPGRAAATTIGLALSTAILIFAYFSNDALDWLVGREFREIQRYDLKVQFEEGRSQDAARELARQCVCGVYNPSRAAGLLERLAAT